jgi:hypothetical protein
MQIRPTLPAEELRLARTAVIVGWIKVTHKNATVFFSQNYQEQNLNRNQQQGERTGVLSRL